MKPEFIAIDLAEGPDQAAIMVGGRRCGKTQALRRAVVQQATEHPNVTIYEITKHGIRVEKPVSQS